MNMKRFIHTITTCCLLIAMAESDSAIAEQPLSFARDIRPILSDNCFACHGPDESAREADLRLDIRQNAVEHQAFVAGSVDESEMMRRILSDDEDERMPPRHSRKELTDKQVALIRRWIDEGAKYETHWAYRPLLRPKVPAIKHPRNDSPIDAFVLDGLAAQGLDLAPQADKVTLIRRLYLDLLGVPPLPAEVDLEIKDDSPDAWEKLVDRLLRDQRFGERMAVYWLDLVRYADTIGYHSDTTMEVSAFREYVIDAFNNNKPFDQFTIEQLAGDLLPEPTESQLVASGYNRLLQTTEEGGAQAKEYIAIYAADRVRNVSGVWMAATVGCAQCHDHKYDPITTRDFYSMAAFFADIKETAVGKRQPNLKLYSDADKAKIASLKNKIASLQLTELLSTNEQLAAKVAVGQQAWEAKSLALADADKPSWKTPEPSKLEATGGVVLKRQTDGSILSTGENPDQGDYTVSIDSFGTIRTIRLEVFPDPSFPNQAGFARGNGNFVLTGLHVTAGDREVEIGSAVADYEQKGFPIAHAFDDDDKTSGWAVDGHHKKADKHTAILQLKQPIEFGDDCRVLSIRLVHQSGYGQHLLGRFRISVTDQPSAALLEEGSLSEELVGSLRTPPGERSDVQVKMLADHYRGIAPELDEWKKKLADTEQELKDVEAGVRTMLVTETLAEPRMTRILPRGNWLDESGEVVLPAVPQFLPHAKIEDRRANRLDLAKWLVDDSNPLTSRTFMNRLWKMYFGRGLSRDLDDLGGQGEPPTHPELLDWLAVEFRESGWDVKQMVRLIVTSSSYRQSSVASEQLRAIDSDNRWYARQGRWRLEAEFVRDTILQISGLLVDDRPGGRSVKPYQPAGYWQHLNFPQRTWQAGQGSDLYRRSVYTFWCRTFLHPAMLAFDATSREECTAERARSNIPQQALVLLNDPTFVEASRVFAGRILQTEGDTDARIAWAFREAVSRDPTSEERSLLKSLYENQLDRYHRGEADAEALLGVGTAANPDNFDQVQLAAWTQVARAIVNLYETTSRF